MCGNTDIALMLLNICKNYELETDDGWRLIHIASFYCEKEVIYYLLEKNVAVTTPIKKYKGKNLNYLPINLIELNINIDELEKNKLIDYIITLMDIQF